MFLTPADLHDLTGYRLGAWQARWLAAHGWIFERDAFGRPRVLRAYAEGRLGLGGTGPQGLGTDRASQRSHARPRL